MARAAPFLSPGAARRSRADVFLEECLQPGQERGAVCFRVEPVASPGRRHPFVDLVRGFESIAHRFGLGERGALVFLAVGIAPAVGMVQRQGRCLVMVEKRSCSLRKAR